MKSIIRIFVLSIIILLLVISCFTYVSFEKSAPPEIMLNEPKNSIAFINTFDYTIPDFASKNENNVYRAAITEVIDGLKAFFTNNEQIDFHVINNLSDAYEATGNEKAAEYWFNKSK